MNHRGLGGVVVGAMGQSWRRPDHFYWLTAFLSAHGMQALTRRLIIAVVIGLGVMPVAMMWSPAGPQGRNRLIAVVVAACTAVLALLWARRRWPSRAQSRAFVVIAAVSVAIACLIEADPLAGLVGCVGFAVLAAHVALFHTSPFTVFNAAVAGVTSVLLAIRLAAGGDVVLACVAVSLVALVIFTVAFSFQSIIRLAGIGADSADDLEPLTGLFNRDAFYRECATLLAARSRADDRHVVIVVLSLDNFALLTDTEGRGAGDRIRIAVARALRATTRSGAVVAHANAEEFWIADTFDSADCTPLAERVRRGIVTTPGGLRASIGTVAAPMHGLADCPPYALLDELIALAVAEMRNARRAGGNQTAHTVCAQPRALVEPNPPCDTDES